MEWQIDVDSLYYPEELLADLILPSYATQGLECALEWIPDCWVGV